MIKNINYKRNIILIILVTLVLITDSSNNTCTKYLCRVFYHKLVEINLWKATIAFFPEHKNQVSVLVCSIQSYLMCLHVESH